MFYLSLSDNVCILDGDFVWFTCSCLKVSIAFHHTFDIVTAEKLDKILRNFVVPYSQL